jgi:hypothetical protein
MSPVRTIGIIMDGGHRPHGRKPASRPLYSSDSSARSNPVAGGPTPLTRGWISIL